MQNLNLHPIFVHFPIALLSVYSLLELIRFKFVTRQTYWFYIKALLVIVGAASGYFAILTGDTAKHLVQDAGNRHLISEHELMAKLSVLIYSAIAAAYFVAWLRTLDLPIWARDNILWKIIVKIQQIISETPLVILLALLGAAALLVTGALGGAIVYGNSFDPFTAFLTKLLVK